MTTPAFRNRLLLLTCAATACSGLAGCGWMRTALQFKDNACRSIADRAVDARADGKDDEALRLFQQAAENDPEAPDLHREMAHIYADREQHDLAIKHLERVVELDADNGEAWAHLATALDERGHTSRAVVAANRALVLDSDHTAALLVRARALEQNRPDDALEVCHRLLEIEPGNVEARLAVARMHLRNGDANRAAPVLRSLCACPLADDHEKAEAWWALGIAYGRVGRWTDAVRALETGAGERPPTADDLYRLAFAQREAGALPEARLTLTELRRRQPDHPDGIRLAVALDPIPGDIVPTSALDVPVPAGW